MRLADISVVILTYNRADILKKNLSQLNDFAKELNEIIVVDNSANSVTEEMVQSLFPQVKYIHNEINAGVAGRNLGIRIATGDIVVTLDDDVIGISLSSLGIIARRFSEQSQLSGLCFRVLHFETGEICNWCHHRKSEEDGEGTFRTYEISEGAVAFRRTAIIAAGCYFEGYFISHEGKDLAYRLMNLGYFVAYEGSISVIHSHDIAGRPTWRRYYYDTRNAIWLAVRNMPLWYGIRFLAFALLSMGIYSLRDGFLKYWIKAIRDGIKDERKIRESRIPWTSYTASQVREINQQRPSFWYKVQKRLFRRSVQI